MNFRGPVSERESTLEKEQNLTNAKNDHKITGQNLTFRQNVMDDHNEKKAKETRRNEAYQRMLDERENRKKRKERIWFVLQGFMLAVAVVIIFYFINENPFKNENLKNEPIAEPQTIKQKVRQTDEDFEEAFEEGDGRANGN